MMQTEEKIRDTENTRQTEVRLQKATTLYVFSVFVPIIIDREQENGLFIVQTSIYRYELRQRRKPTAVCLSPGERGKRYANRQLAGVLCQAPPRITRD